jgi:hypothetical protein
LMACHLKRKKKQNSLSILSLLKRRSMWCEILESKALMEKMELLSAIFFKKMDFSCQEQRAATFWQV